MRRFKGLSEQAASNRKVESQRLLELANIMNTSILVGMIMVYAR